MSMRRNWIWPWQVAVLGIGLAAAPHAQAVAQLAGLWEFDDPSHLFKAKRGQDLVVLGTAPVRLASVADDHGAALSGVIVTRSGAAHALRALHQIPANGGGSRVNQYSILLDLFSPAASRGSWRALFQTAATPTANDADYFIRNSDDRLGVGDMGYSGSPIDETRWTRLVLTVDLTLPSNKYRTYLNGALFHLHTGTSNGALDGRFALYPDTNPNGILFFADDDGENASLHVAALAIFDATLTSDEVAALGGAGDPIPLPHPDNQTPTVAPPVAGPTATTTGAPVDYTLTASDPDGDDVQVQIDWGDGTFSPWTPWTRSGGEHTLSRSWNLPGTYTLNARARDTQGGISTWIKLQSVDVSGPPLITFATPPYLQNMSQTTMVVMAEIREDYPLVLEFGTSPDYGSSVAMASVASGGGTTFIRGILTGLKPGATYHYRIASAEGDSLTSNATFRTAPDRWEDFTFGALGDTQTGNGGVWQADPWEPAKSMLRHMVDQGVAFGLGLGDHASDGDSYSSTRQAHLDRWATLLGPHVPFYISWGNHDGNSPEHPLRLSADMPSRWQIGSSPSLRTPGYGNFSFSYSGVFFVCLDYFQTHNRAGSDPTNDLTNGWLDAQLASPEARDARFRVVAVHIPPYCERWIDGNATLRSQLVRRMEHYGVDLCFSGHMHGYERGHLNGVNYVIAGGGSYLDFPEPLVTDWPHMFLGGTHNGQPAHVPGTYARQIAFGLLGPPEPIVGGLFHGYAQVTIRDRYLRLDMHGFNADGSYAGIHDSFDIGTDPGPDTDGDGMRDAWEIAHSLDPHDPADAQLDSDGDGMTNRDEFLAGTDPNDPASRLAIVDIQPQEQFTTVHWLSVPGRHYRLEWSANLRSWTGIEHPAGQPLTVTAAEGTRTSVDLALPHSAASPTFLRVRVLHP